MSVLLSGAHKYIKHGPAHCRGQKRMSDPWEPELTVGYKPS